MSFFCFSQNNSGGSFQYQERGGISKDVIVEADDWDDANNRAESIGIYFDPDSDCPSCGQRWWPKDRHDECDEEPIVLGVNPLTTTFEEMNSRPGYTYFHKWIDGYEGFIHYKDGTVKGFWPVSESKKAKKRKVKKLGI